MKRFQRELISFTKDPLGNLAGFIIPSQILGTASAAATIFNLPGLGRLLLIALNNRDYPVVSGINLFFATGVVGINLLIDLLYADAERRAGGAAGRSAVVALRPGRPPPRTPSRCGSGG